MMERKKTSKAKNKNDENHSSKNEGNLINRYREMEIRSYFSRLIVSPPYQ
jgi:hypothetical protein